ncbi:MerR family transcriptional regulator [Phytomonospora sp. NPDC050363]|uniref:MerR family transcriptional regulator n=1 Tax=Phytomonospora sp. NPDC050363 TaxID=3155642 RepID=UPI0033FADDBB
MTALSPFDGPGPRRAVYSISVAAELVGLAPQTLRLYEARGLIEPDRTSGGTRRYSADNLLRLQRIGNLLTAGLNLAGVKVALELEAENARLRAELAQARARLSAREGR